MSVEKNLLIHPIREKLREQKQLADRAVAQVSDEQLLQALDKDNNSIAILMKHMGGNLRSRFTDFLTSDGEKPDRNRDSEFEDDGRSRAAIVSSWEQGWACLFAALDPLTDNDLARQVTIRNQPHTVAEALLRALSHASYHVGQIVQLARYFAKDRWQSLSIPRGTSRAFNAKMDAK